jgi:hypothetical protein
MENTEYPYDIEAYWEILTLFCMNSSAGYMNNKNNGKVPLMAA